MRTLPAPPTPVSVLLALLGAVLLAACGEDEPRRHGLGTTPLEGEPTGAPVEVRYAFEDGETWGAQLVLDVHQTQSRTDRPGTQEARAKSTFALRQTYLSGGATPRSRTRLVYTSIQDGAGKDVEVPEGATRGVFRHRADGRPDPTSLTLQGEHVAESKTLYRSLLLAGLAGTEPWVPPRPVREGETWPASAAIDPQLLKSISALGLRPDVELPPATMTGTIKLERIERDDETTLLHLRIDALVEIEGTTRSDEVAGEMSTAYRVEGVATVDARTGLPVVLDTRAVMENHERMAGQAFDQNLRLSLRGTAQRIEGR